MVCLIVAARIVVLKGFCKIEAQHIRLDVERVMSEFSNIYLRLGSKAGDWAPWDETYAFVHDRDERYIKENLMPNTLINLNVNFMLFFNNSKKLVYGKLIDLASGKDVPVPTDLLNKINSTPLLLEHSDSESSKTGMIMVASTSVFIASRPIFKNNFAGPNGGTLLIGRYLEPTEIKKISDFIHLSFNVYPFTATQMPAEPVANNVGEIIEGRVVAIDITRRRQLQEQLIQSEHLVALGQLSASIAHEVNSPLEGISALLSVIKKTYVEEKELNENVDLIQEAFDRIRDTVRNLLDLNRPGSEHKTPININDVIDNTINLLKGILRKNRIQYKLDLSSKILDINASPQKLGQVFLNIINNSIEAMTKPTENKTLNSYSKPEIEIETSLIEDHIVIIEPAHKLEIDRSKITKM